MMKKQTFMVLALVWMLAACAPAAPSSQMPSPTLSPTWGIQDFRNPPTILDYIAEVQLDQTTRIEYLNPVTLEQVVITTEPTIQSIVELLSSPTDICAGTPESSDHALLILMIVPAEDFEHRVSVDYRPVTSDVLMDNIPTGSWPIKIRGAYSVCPDFGRSLFELLGIDGSTALTQPPPPTSTPLPTPNPTQTSSPGLALSGEDVLFPSPDGQWTVILDREVGSIEIEDTQGKRSSLFPAGSQTISVSWSPDSASLVMALFNGKTADPTETVVGMAEIWLASVEGAGLSEPRLLYRPARPGDIENDWITFGAWSPDSRRVLFWAGPPSASIQSDGLPLWSLDVETGSATRLSETTLMNPAYQSWAPDGSVLVFTDGGYRSAQVNKWLSLYEVESGQVRSLQARSEFIPGAVAWSPAGDTIVLAAVRASQTGDEWADWMSWENPAILARRIYLLDPQAGEYRRLNATEAYQDAPRWSADGAKLYYVQIDDDQVVLMAADPETGEAIPLPSCQAPLPSRAGYYGQVDWSDLYAACSALSVSSIPAPTASPLDIFSLYLGTSWEYTFIGYSQSPSDPNQIIEAISRIKEAVVDVQSYPGFTLVHVLGCKTMVAADPEWQENGTFGLGVYGYWYVIQGGSVYLSYSMPDPTNIQADQMLQEYQFPMAPGAGWCPSKLGKGYLTPPAETPVPCANAGKRVVEMEEPYQTPAGSFEHCHQMRDMVNSRGVVQWFCDGVGVVAKKYDHAGSRFGFTQELTAFTLGIPSTAELSATPTPQLLPDPWLEYEGEFWSQAGVLHYRLRYPGNWWVYPGMFISQPGLEGQTYIQNFPRPVQDITNQSNQEVGMVKLAVYALPCQSTESGPCPTELPEIAENLPGTRTVRESDDGWTL